MPIYEYACEACGKIFEEFEPTAVTVKKEKECPACGSKETRRVVSSFSSSGSSVQPAAPSCGSGHKGPFT